MRIIWYVLDGLTPCMIRALNDNDKNIDDLAPVNFIDSLSKNSFIIKNCYGHGETMASLSAMVTGLDVQSVKSDMPLHPNAYNAKMTLASYLKNNGYFGIFYRSFPPDGLRRNGAYKRYNLLESYGFDRVCLEDETVPFQESTFLKQHEDFFLLNDNRPTYIFIHDLCLHDHPLVQRHGTKEGLSKAIVECSNQVRMNLEYLKYNEDNDLLIFSSDHGMTLSPYDDLFFDKNISDETISRYWPKLVADFKLKTCFFIKGPDIVPGEANGIFEIRDMFATVLDFLHVDHIATGAVSAKNEVRSAALISLSKSTFEKFGSKSLSPWFHSYLVYIENSKKWIYRKSINAECYCINLTSNTIESEPVVVEFSSFPLDFREYIKDYFSMERSLYRLFYAYHPRRIIAYLFKKIYSWFK